MHLKNDDLKNRYETYSAKFNDAQVSEEEKAY